MFKMKKLRIYLWILGIILSKAWTIHCQCSRVRGVNGTISDNVRISSTHRECWEVHVPPNKFIRLNVVSLSLSSSQCSSSYLRILVNDTNEDYNFCSNDVKRNPVTALSDVDVIFYDSYGYGGYRTISFTLNYEIRDLECARKNSFHCTNFTCIPRAQVCDRVKDCENGADEVGCETGVLSIPGVVEARNRSVSWLISKRTPSWGWRESTPRAVTSLYLAGEASFDGTNLEEELMAKHTELMTAVALLKKPISDEQLAMFINALLVTCHDPRHFYGQNLVTRLKNQVKSPSNFTHPIAYLALCNANESWPERAVTDITNILSSDSEYPFVTDIQAFALMAISCIKNRAKTLNHSRNVHLMSLYKNTIQHFKQRQMSDGSFGNIHTTALVTQALISSDQEHASDWKLNATIKYLIKELSSSHADFLATYLALPILAGKSLSDISKVNCTSHPRKHGNGDLIDDIYNYIGPKMRVQYSLFVGDERDVVHTMSLRIPENFTAYEVMQLAEVEDSKYKFDWKMINNKMYIYFIGKITNDPESGKFWLLYLGSNNSTGFNHTTTSPDNLKLQEGDHLVMWYRTAEIYQK